MSFSPRLRCVAESDRYSRKGSRLNMRCTGRHDGHVALWILFTVAALATISYCFSQPFKARVDERARQLATWSPENICMDPVGYLTWACNETSRIREELNSRQTALDIESRRQERLSRDEQANAHRLDALMTDLVLAYRMPVATNAPRVVRGQLVDEARLKSMIVETEGRRASLAVLASNRCGLVVGLKVRRQQVSDKIAESASLLEDLKARRDMGAAQLDLRSLGGIQNRLGALMDAGLCLIPDRHSMQLDDLLYLDPSTGNESQFLEIMARR